LQLLQFLVQQLAVIIAVQKLKHFTSSFIPRLGQEPVAHVNVKPNKNRSLAGQKDQIEVYRSAWLFIAKRSTSAEQHKQDHQRG
jgi:hypothetical protein